MTRLTLMQWIAFTAAAADSAQRRLDVETDATAALILQNGLDRLRLQLEMLRLTDQELAEANAEADPRAAEADFARIEAIQAEHHRRSQLSAHERMAEAVERRRL